MPPIMLSSHIYIYIYDDIQEKLACIFYLTCFAHISLIKTMCDVNVIRQLVGREPPNLSQGLVLWTHLLLLPSMPFLFVKLANTWCFERQVVVLSSHFLLRLWAPSRPQARLYRTHFTAIEWFPLTRMVQPLGWPQMYSIECLARRNTK